MYGLHPLLVAAAFALGLLVPRSPERQEDPAAPFAEAGRYATPADSEATAMVLRGLRVQIPGPLANESFVYPLEGRRNPFLPPAASTETGVAFSSLSLAGIIYAPQAGSVVVLADSATGRRYRLRVGDRVMGVRLVHVETRRAIFRVRSDGTTERPVFRVLRLGETGPRGSDPEGE